MEDPTPKPEPKPEPEPEPVVHRPKPPPVKPVVYPVRQAAVPSLPPRPRRSLVQLALLITAPAVIAVAALRPR
ncbi:hypothetical protein [Streptomyces fragilis]|uniref:Uncharacterized protein n=1 Tax=Streptomyces fragilis TaxID=67301 RepID=A0ABV2YKU4_9ACTN